MKRFKIGAQVMLVVLLFVFTAFSMSASGDIEETIVAEGQSYLASGMLSVYADTTYSANAYTGLDTDHGYNHYLEAMVTLYPYDEGDESTLRDSETTYDNMFVYAHVGGMENGDSASGYHKVWVFDFYEEVNMETGVLEPVGSPITIFDWTGYTDWDDATDDPISPNAAGEIFREQIQETIR